MIYLLLAALLCGSALAAQEDPNSGINPYAEGQHEVTGHQPGSTSMGDEEEEEEEGKIDHSQPAIAIGEGSAPYFRRELCHNLNFLLPKGWTCTQGKLDVRVNIGHVSHDVYQSYQTQSDGTRKLVSTTVKPQGQMTICRRDGDRTVISHVPGMSAYARATGYKCPTRKMRVDATTNRWASFEQDRYCIFKCVSGPAGNEVGLTVFTRNEHRKLMYNCETGQITMAHYTSDGGENGKSQVAILPNHKAGSLVKLTLHWDRSVTFELVGVMGAMRTITSQTYGGWDDAPYFSDEQDKFEKVEGRRCRLPENWGYTGAYQPDYPDQSRIFSGPSVYYTSDKYCTRENPTGFFWTAYMKDANQTITIVGDTYTSQRDPKAFSKRTSLPPGWRSAVDDRPASRTYLRTYYIDPDGKATWHLPPRRRLKGLKHARAASKRRLRRRRL